MMETQWNVTNLRFVLFECHKRFAATTNFRFVVQRTLGLGAPFLSSLLKIWGGAGSLLYVALYS